MKTKAPTPQSCLLGLLAAFGHTASSDKETASQMVPTVWLLFRPLIGPQNSPGYAKTVKSLQCYFLQVRGKSEINSQGWRKNWSNWSFFFFFCSEVALQSLFQPGSCCCRSSSLPASSAAFHPGSPLAALKLPEPLLNLLLWFTYCREKKRKFWIWWLVHLGIWKKTNKKPIQNIKYLRFYKCHRNELSWFSFMTGNSLSIKL